MIHGLCDCFYTRENHVYWRTIKAEMRLNQKINDNTPNAQQKDNGLQNSIKDIREVDRASIGVQCDMDADIALTINFSENSGDGKIPSVVKEATPSITPSVSCTKSTSDTALDKILSAIVNIHLRRNENENSQVNEEGIRAEVLQHWPVLNRLLYGGN